MGITMSEIKEKHIKKYRSLCKQMQKLLDDIGEYSPEVHIYIEDAGNWNLMNGPSHDDTKSSLPPLHDNVVAHEFVSPSGGGGW